MKMLKIEQKRKGSLGGIPRLWREGALCSWDTKGIVGEWRNDGESDEYLMNITNKYAEKETKKI